MYFKKIKYLTELEQSNKWSEAINYLYNEWFKNKTDVDLLIRTATECWYVMSNSELLNTNDILYQYSQDTLIETYNYAIDNFQNNEKVLLMFGYMLSLFPSFFYVNDYSNKKYLEFENKGKTMLKTAEKMNPDNYLIKIICHGSNNKSNLKIDKNNLLSYLNENFSDDTAIEEYFKEVLLM